MKFHRLFPCLALLAALPWLAACSFTRVADYPYFDEEAFSQSAPHTLAIAPMEDTTGSEVLGAVMRTKLYGALAHLPYEDIELIRVDGVLNSKAMQSNIPLDELDPFTIAEPDLADAVIFARLEKVSRIFLIFYARIRIEVRLLMVDTKTKRYLYVNHYIVNNRSITAPTDIIGLVTGFATSLWFMREEEMNETLERAAEEIAKRFPVLSSAAVSGSIYIDEVRVILPRATVREGERITLQVRGTPYQMATFSIGETAVDVRLAENAPGEYSGFYVVRRGDDARYLYPTVTLANRQNTAESVTLGVYDQPFAIDTIPPAPYEIESWLQAPGRAGVILRFQPAAPNQPEAGEVPVRFYVFRGRGVGGPLTFLGSSETAQYEDATAEPGVEYEYTVIVADAAGNQSDEHSRVRVVPRATANPNP